MPIVTARYIVGAIAIFGALAVASLVTYSRSRELYLTVDGLLAEVAVNGTVSVGPVNAGENGDSQPRSGPGAIVPSPDRLAWRTDHRPVRVRGRLVRDSLVASTDVLGVRFVMAGETSRMPVHYEGVVPDALAQADTVTVRGHLSADGVFRADELLVQCPSKYRAAPVPQATRTPVDGPYD